ncbi:tetratricopeptide repeat protein [Azospirillum sp. sgz301742]
MSVADTLHTAMAHHQAGRFDEAAQGYATVLRLQPKHPDALHLMGLVEHKRGNGDLAVDFIRRALKFNPKWAEVHANLGAVLYDLGRHDPAAAALRQSIALKKDHYEAHVTMGLVLLAKARPVEAEASFRRALALRPDSAKPRIKLADALAAQGRHEDALSVLDEAPALADDGAALLCRGAALMGLGREDDAVAALDAAAQRLPGDPGPHIEMGNLHQVRGRFDKAEACFLKAAELDSGSVAAWNNLGSLRQDQGRNAEALQAYGKARDLCPQLATVHYNIGTLHEDLGAFKAALAAYREATVQDANYADAHWNLALLKLLTGDWHEGFAAYEWRWRRNGAEPLPVYRNSQPWNGKPKPGRSILLFGEQGLGDTIQFVRFAGRVAALGMEVVLHVQPALVRLFQGLPGIRQVVARDETPPRTDYHAALMSLPHLLRLAPKDAAMPAYLAAPAEPRRTDKRRVGLVWAGNAGHRNDANRSIPAALLGDLVRGAPDVEFVSLQVGPAAGALSGVADAGSGFTDFADTAAVIGGLDLVISVDTAPAHLAGALGCPTWVLLPAAPDWRWGLGRDDTPWYPSARLFRQPSPGDWPAVIAAVGAALGGASKRA